MANKCLVDTISCDPLLKTFDKLFLNDFKNRLILNYAQQFIYQPFLWKKKTFLQTFASSLFRFNSSIRDRMHLSK